MAEIKLVRLKKRGDDAPTEPKPSQPETDAKAPEQQRSGVRKVGIKPPLSEPLPAVPAVEVDLKKVQAQKLQKIKAAQSASSAKAKAGNPAAGKGNNKGNNKANNKANEKSKPAAEKAAPKGPAPAKKKKKPQRVLPPRLETLTPEQEEQLAKYRTKWQKVAVSTTRVNRDRATQTIQDLYAYANKPEPEVLFLDGPDLTVLQHFLNTQHLYTPAYLLRKPSYALNKAIRAKVGRLLRKRLHDYFMTPPLSGFSEGMYTDLSQQLQRDEEDPIAKLEMSIYAYYDFAQTLIDDPKVVAKEWKLLQTWAKEGQWSFTFENICVICDHPTKINRPKNGPVQIIFPNGGQF